MIAAVAASKGTCGPANELQAELMQLDPTLHEEVYGHPELVACTTQETERRQLAADCIPRRVAAMRDAQMIADPRTRGEALMRIPRCKPAR